MSETGAMIAMIVPVLFAVVMFVLLIISGINPWSDIKDTYKNTYPLYAHSDDNQREVQAEGPCVESISWITCRCLNWCDYIVVIPTIQEIHRDVLTTLANQYWAPHSKLPKNKFSEKIIERIYYKEIGHRFPIRRIMLLEFSQYLELYLWPNFTLAVCHPHTS